MYNDHMDFELSTMELIPRQNDESSDKDGEETNTQESTEDTPTQHAYDNPYDFSGTGVEIEDRSESRGSTSESVDTNKSSSLSSQSLRASLHDDGVDIL